ncbi:MAG: glycosyltransferase family 1 protein [Halioglobus sp.]
MRLVIGGDSLFGPPTGIGHYTSHLVENLVDRSEIEELKLLAYGVLITTAKAGINSEGNPPNKESGSDGKPSSLFGNIRGMAARNSLMIAAYEKAYAMMARWSLRQYGPNDVFHSPSFVLPPFPGRRVVTILDLSTIRFPEHHAASTVTFINNHIERAIKHADHILTISDFVREEIIDHFDYPEEKITTTYLGADESFRPISKAEFSSSSFSPELQFKQYFLSVSTIEPRKNLARLLDAYEVYQQQQGSNALPLILTGLAGWKSSDIHARLEALQSKGLVRYLGYVSQRELSTLFAGARALLFPSLYEGFGLPVVEAMKSGTAVITSQASAMAEIAGDAALYINPSDVSDIAAKIGELAKNHELENRLVSKCLERANVYSWARCADLTLNAYKNLAG